MAMIHPSAHVAAGARIADTVEIGPNCTIGDDVTIGPGCHLAAFVNIGGSTSIGRDTRIEAFASLGTPPQSIAAGDSTGRLVVGAGCNLGGHVTINVGTRDGGGVTRVGDRCRMLAYSHIAHDCSIGSDVTLGIGVALAGHCQVGDFTQFDNYSAAHQFSHVGASAVVEMRTFVRSDVIPFGLAAGDLSYLRGLNRPGLRQRAFGEDDIDIAEEAYRGIFFGADTFASRLNLAAGRYQGHILADQIIDFIRAVRRRPLCHPQRQRTSRRLREMA